MGRPARRIALFAFVAFTLLAVTGIALAYALGGSSDESPAAHTPDGPASSVFSSELVSAVTSEGVLEHVRRFQSIADENGGNRAAGTPGYDASAAYVAGELREAGYDVSVQRFEFPNSAASRDADLAVVGTAGEAPDFELHADFAPMERSAGGEAEAPLAPVDVDSDDSGCGAGDFAGFQEGSVALMRRGACVFGEKVANAEAAGASAALIFNDGGPGEAEVLLGTLGEQEAGIPVIGTSAESGRELAVLAEDGRTNVRVSVAGGADGTTTNVIAETPGGDAGNTVMVGAHLDSVVRGPGINDNASGSAAVLEIAQQMARLDVEPRNRVRFAFWGAEELGLVGSRHYVEELDEDELEELSAYLNFDMIGSPNFVRTVYEGPDEVEGVFDAYYEERGVEAQVDSALDGRSDHGPFQDEGVPTGGLFSGASGAKTQDEAEAYGGAAGVPYDACYHEACDDLDNVNRRALGQLSDGAAHATATLAAAPRD